MRKRDRIRVGYWIGLTVAVAIADLYVGFSIVRQIIRQSRERG